MSAAFDDIRLPSEIEQGSTGGPSFNTSIIRLSNNAESRNQNWQSQQMIYDVGYGLTSSEQTDAQDFYTLMKFFYARRGRFRGFRFKDWTDFQGFAEPALQTDNDGKVWQLQKVYNDGVQTYSRKITRPVAGSVTIFANGIALDQSTYTVDYTKGTITFPGTQAVVEGTFEFDVPVRFDTDTFTLTIQLFNAAEIQSLNIVEVQE